MKKRAFDVETLDDYDIERIADKIEKTGRIATAVHEEVCDQVKILAARLDSRIDQCVRSKIRKERWDVVKDEPYIKLLKYILEELTNANQS